MRGFLHGHSVVPLLMATTAIVFVNPALAQTQSFDVAAGPAPETIPVFAKQAHIQIIARGSVVRLKRTAAVKGRYSLEQGLTLLLAGTNLRANSGGRTGIITIEEAPASGEAEAGLAPADQNNSAALSDNAEVLVTGTRLNAPVASPTRHVSRQEMENSGFSDVGQALRALPQNFSGGQNPGVLAGAAIGGNSNSNTNNASSPDLRGIGPDATLTLLDGHRLSYGGFSQAIDVSAIPLAAIERVDVVADGASAIYGSDAVAGVVNLILRRDFDGLTASARLGGAMAGGDNQQQYDLVGGARWSSGGFMATYDYSSTTPFSAVQRNYTAYMGDPYDLLDREQKHSAVLTLHQDLTPNVEFTVDGTFLHRSYGSTVSIAAYSEVLTSPNRDTNWSVAPDLTIRVGRDWKVQVSGVYARDKAVLDETDYYSGVIGYHSVACYCNSVEGGELSARGTLLSLPAGAVRLAFGGGYRRETFHTIGYTSGVRDGGSQADGYGFAELFVPLVSSDMDTTLVRSLSATAALRYENYQRSGQVVTPKLGLIYSPNRTFDLKFSWGKSFKAPTLNQQFEKNYAFLMSSDNFIGFPGTSDQTVLLAEGGSKDLKPERSNNWTVTLDAHPEQVPGLTLEASYYRVHYRQRVINPIPYYLNAFDGNYKDFIITNPTQAQQAAFIAAAPDGLQFYGASAYDPSKVVAILDTDFVNAAGQVIEGADLSANFRNPSDRMPIALSADFSWLRSQQRNSAATAYFALAGTAYNPPHVRFRTGAGWDGQPLKAFVYLNYTGPVRDIRVTPSIDGRAMKTVDMTLSFKPPVTSGAFKGVDLSLSILNLFDQRPPYLAPAAAYYEPYDSANYTAIGRFAQVTLAKHF